MLVSIVTVILLLLNYLKFNLGIYGSFTSQHSAHRKIYSIGNKLQFSQSR